MKSGSMGGPHLVSTMDASLQSKTREESIPSMAVVVITTEKVYASWSFSFCSDDIMSWVCAAVTGGVNELNIIELFLSANDDFEAYFVREGAKDFDCCAMYNTPTKTNKERLRRGI